MYIPMYMYHSLVGVGDDNASGRDFLRACASDTRSDLFLETSSRGPACLSLLGSCGELGGVEVPDGFLRITISCTGLRLFGVVPRERGLLLGVSSWLLEYGGVWVRKGAPEEDECVWGGVSEWGGVLDWVGVDG